jgi:hypothetical protein
MGTTLGRVAWAWVVAAVTAALWPAIAGAADMPVLPLAFTPNRGQARRAVRYLARGPGYAVALRSGGLRVGGVDVGLLGARHARPVGGRRLRGRVNYLHGDDPKRWLRNLPTFGSVRYPETWPGIGTVFHGDAERLEFDFHVAPGADARRIGLRVRGHRPRLTREGALRISGVTLKAPYAYQRGAPVTSRFIVRPHGVVRIRLGRYDHRRPLLVDPAIGYSTWLGGRHDDEATAVAIGPDGDAYLTGYAQSGYPTTPGVFSRTAQDEDVFVTRLDPDKSGAASLVWSTFIGGNGHDSGNAIAVNASGQAFVGGNVDAIGSNSPPGFPTTAGAYQSGFAGARDGFVTRFSADGSSLIYSTYVGSVASDAITGIALDSSNRAYAYGTTLNGPLEPRTDTTVQPTTGLSEVMLAVLNPTGTAAPYFTTYGGSSSDEPGGIAVDPDADVAYVAGGTFSSNIRTTAGVIKPTRANDNSLEAFAAKIDTGLAAGHNDGLKYGTYLGSHTAGTAIAVDGSGRAFLAGTIEAASDGGSFPATSGAFQTGAQGGVDGFAAKLTAGADDLVYGTRIGGSDDDMPTAIAISAGTAFVGGTTASDDLPTNGFPVQTAPIQFNPTTPFVTKFNTTGTDTQYSTYIGGGNLTGLAVDADGYAYLAGYSLMDWPARHAYQPAATDPSDPFSAEAVFAKLVRHVSAQLTCADNSPVIGQPDSCTITVSDPNADADRPSGSVDLSTTGGGAFGASSCTLTDAAAAGDSSCARTYTATATGSQTLTASYDGDDTHGAASDTRQLTVGKRATTRTLDCTPGLVGVNAVTSCSVTIADGSPGTASTPTGVVSFGSDGAGAFGAPSCVLIVGHCTQTFKPSAIGSQNITATYPGDGDHVGGTAGDGISVTTRATQATLSCVPATVPSGVASSCTAHVTDTDTGDASTPTGSVSAAGGPGAFSGAPCALDGAGTCTFTYTPLLPGAGPHTLTGSYGGDGTHHASSATFDVTVTLRSSATAFSCTPAAVHAGLPATCTATVTDTSPGNAATPSGTVDVATTGSGALSAAHCTLDHGACSVGYTPATVGTDHLTAAFAGDVAHDTSSAATDVEAEQRTTAATLACVPASLDTGATTACTATVTDTDGGALIAPTGSVALTGDGAGTFAAPTCSLAPEPAPGTSRCTLGYVPAAPGTQTITATYGGSALHAAASAATSQLTVSPVPTPTPTPTPESTSSPAPSPTPSPTVTPTPTPTPVDTPLLRCGGLSIRLLDVEPVNHKVRVAGIALLRYAGRRAAIEVARKRIAFARIRRDGTFSALVHRRAFRYTASIDGHRSEALHLRHRLQITSIRTTRRGARVRGRLHSGKPAGRKLLISRQTSCTHTRLIGSTRTDRRGRFRVTLPRPHGHDTLAVYRLKTATGFRTFTLPVVVRR